jgi:hypothetical protein
MIRCPDVEPVMVIGDDACLIAEISSFFRRQGRYLPVCDGPRMGRPDFDNEAIRRVNTVAKQQPTRVLLAGLSAEATGVLTQKLPERLLATVSDRQQAAEALRGLAAARERELCWPSSNLGVGLLLARQSNSSLVIDRAAPPRPEILVANGTHALVVCETGEELSRVIAANLAYSINASFLMMPEADKRQRREWLEQLYLIGSREQVVTFEEIAAVIRAALPNEVTCGRYTEIVFVSSEVPWGVAVPECPTSHIYAYPDLGRFVADGIWVGNTPATSARTALLVSPGDVQAADIETMAASLGRNRTLIRRLAGTEANVHAVDMTTRAIPFDIIGIATHAGDCSGARVTYRYPDNEGRIRSLVVDEAIGIGYDPTLDLYPVQTYYAYRELDGIPWDDEEGKERLPVGSAIVAWHAIAQLDRRQHVIAQVAIERVRGATALKMSDHVWLLGGHDLPPSASPVVINNACSSFHNLSRHFAFGGARAYIGTVVPIADVEAHEITTQLFGQHLGAPLATALWRAQRAVYGDQHRRPYVMVGLPFSSIIRNNVRSVRYLRHELIQAIDDYERKAIQHPDEGVRRNSAALRDHLRMELERLNRHFAAHRG